MLGVGIFYHCTYWQQGNTVGCVSWMPGRSFRGHGKLKCLFYSSNLHADTFKLWTAQGAVTMCYPTEDMKGRSFSVFWTIFQAGGVIGSIIPICLNWSSTAGNLNDGSYIAFIIIMLVGCCIPLLLLPSDKVIRTDGTQVVLPPMPTWT